ncbi:MAG: WecB/TagA/CpsF family glycosyltransferase [Candidatus Peregrinibacteria bacterium]|nr:WecB/TagA/CpsF family glycosyltransferase [Candidatus Peregrinibacteria bacterium]
MASPRITLLGIPIDAVTQTQAIEKLRVLVTQPGQHHVMTPNSEMLVASVRDATFRSVLQKSALNLPDSIGLVWMAKMTGQHLPERVTGVDTVTKFLTTLSPEHSVFLLGSAPGIADRAAETLMQMNAQLNIVGTHAGSPRDEDAPAIIEKIRSALPSILLVAYGAPAQDLWVDQHLASLPSVRLAMGVGGTFDFLAGTRKRAPLILQSLGLEWMWRLLLEPKRWKRIWNAVVVFPWFVLRYGKETPVSA